MQYISSKLGALLVLLCCINLAAQQRTNPVTQIRWPLATGTVNPVTPAQACTTVNYGQPYTNTTTGVLFVCAASGWTVTGSGATTPATNLLYKGNNTVNGVVAATPGTDYVVPSGNVATATALAASPTQCTGSQFAQGVAPNGNANCGTPAGGGGSPGGVSFDNQTNISGAFAAGDTGIYTYTPSTHTLNTRNQSMTGTFIQTAVNALANGGGDSVTNSVTCTQNYLPGDTGSVNGTAVCLSLPNYRDWFAGWDYGNPGENGVSASNVNWFSGHVIDATTNSSSAGIHSMFATLGTYSGPGDLNYVGLTANIRQAWIAGSDEGAHMVRKQLDELSPYNGTVATNSNNNTVLTFTGSGANPGLNSPLLDFNTKTSCTLSSANITGGPVGFGSATTSCTLPVSTVASTTNDSFGVISVPRLVGSATSSTVWSSVTTYTIGQTVSVGSNAGLYVSLQNSNTNNNPTAANSLFWGNLSQLSAAVVTFRVNSTTAPTTSTLISLLGPVFYEVVRPLSVTGSSSPYTVTALARYSHPQNTTVCIGGAVGDYFEMTAYSSGSGAGSNRYVEYVACSPTATSIYVGHQVPNGFASFVKNGAGNVYQGADIVGVINPVNGQPDGSYLAVWDNAAFTVGDVVEDVNNISAAYNYDFNIGVLNNPFASYEANFYIHPGLVGGTRTDSNGYSFIQNPLTSTNYVGAGGSYYAPALWNIEGPWSGVLALNNSPVAGIGQGIGPSANCGGYIICVANGPVSGSTTTLEGLFNEGDQATNITYDHASQVFNFNSVGGFNINGSAACTVSSGCSTSAISGQTTGYYAVAGSASTLTSTAHINELTSNEIRVTPGWGFGVNQIGGNDTVGTDGQILVLTGDNPSAYLTQDAQILIGGFNSSQNGTIWMHGVNATNGIFLDVGSGSGKFGGVGIGYTIGSTVPAQFAVQGFADFGCTGITCLASIDSSGNATFPSLTVNGSNKTVAGPAATSSTNFNSPTNITGGSYWTGSAAANNQWSWQDVLGTGANPTSTYTLTHTGSTGTLGVSMGVNFNALSFSAGGTPGVTKTCTVLPTVVGGIITSC